MDFGLQNGAQKRTKFHKVFTFEPLDSSFGSTSAVDPPRTAPGPHFVCFLHHVGFFLDDGGQDVESILKPFVAKTAKQCQKMPKIL